jgi:hypothetical protein
MNINVSVLIGVVGILCSIVSVYLGYRSGIKKERTDKEKECKSEGKESGELKADTEYIKRRIDDVLLEQKDTNKTLSHHADRLARVEESSKSAHH